MEENPKSLSIIRRYFPLEFQISKKSWDAYEFKNGVVPDREEIPLPNIHILRLIIKRIYERKDLEAFSHSPLRAGDLNAIGLINEIYRYILTAYRIIKNPFAYANAVTYTKERITEKQLNKSLRIFASVFPPFGILRGKYIPEKYLRQNTRGIPNRHIIIKEIILLFLANTNPAFSPFTELFSDLELKAASSYAGIFAAVSDFFKTQAGFGPHNRPLTEMLAEPQKAVPYSLEGQLLYIRKNWAQFLPEELLQRISTAADIIKEEKELRGNGPGTAQIPEFKGIPEYQDEYEGFTRDRDWMSSIVVIAKSTYVWLSQLSEKYSRRITRLDEVPDEELDILSRWGFTGLWLIGIWERSPASRRIKQICGNPEAASSAYSIYSYNISADLGGDGAFSNLKERAGRRGIVIASDIVPNHTGIFSKWIIEHPEWFIQTAAPPFPGYRFTGTDLSENPRIGIYIEDGYWSRRDAAVVFKRIDRQTGETQYIYHGNDGTSMPWNDTAQLNFLNPAVREAVIQNIVNIAKRFPVIRLDAAMTLTKKHYQRLWFPHPGTGGGVPSRAEHGIDKKEFDRLMPKEFWRETVDRINREAPDTLLIAEAFWLMEGYFVRTLGMHRVYNSAFMNMLKAEDNAKYRSVIKNVLEFNPEILRRFVNFMNNPDEETAAVQFGKGDKYFGICLLMTTLPGMPMFGHGQVEGRSEKYGMEYKRAYWNEPVDYDLIKRHEHDIFPLMRRRHLFSGVENFFLYDLVTENGSVNENVFAYSNACGRERALILYNNKYSRAKGRIHISCRYLSGGEKAKEITQRNLAEGLMLKNEAGYYYILKEHKSGIEYIRQGSDIHRNGFYIELNAFEYQIFTEIREVKDTGQRPYGELCRHLAGRGVPDMEYALRKFLLRPVYLLFSGLIGKETIEDITAGEFRNEKEFKSRIRKFTAEAKKFVSYPCSEDKAVSDTISGVGDILRFRRLLSSGTAPAPCAEAAVRIRKNLADKASLWKIQVITAVIKGLNIPAVTEGLMLGDIISKTLSEKDALLVNLLALNSKCFAQHNKEDIFCNTGKLLRTKDAERFLNVNRYNGILWFSKERMEELIYRLFITSSVETVLHTKEDMCKGIDIRFAAAGDILKYAEASGYKLTEMLSKIVS